MFEPIAISLSPNTEKDDLFLALKLLFSPWRWKEGVEIKKLEKEFARYLRVKYAISFNSGREAELAILKCLGIKKGDEVLLQAFTCVVVSNSVLWTGALPVYVDIDENDFNMASTDLEGKITSRSKAVIVQHTFGQPAPLDTILPIAKKHNLCVIEDCAHSLGAKHQGKFLGTFGKAAFFSFGRDKVISSVFGGMAVTNDENLGKSLKKYQERLFFPSFFWTFQQLFHPLAFNFLILPMYRFFNLGKGILLLFQKLGLLSLPVEKEEKRSEKSLLHEARLPNALAILALNQLSKLEKFNKKRQKIAQIYEQELKRLPIKLPKIKKGSVCFRYTIRTPQAKKLYQLAKKKGLILGNWYGNVIDPKGTELDKIKYKRGCCPTAERLAKEVINLPTHPRLKKKEVNKIIKFLKAFFRSRKI